MLSLGRALACANGLVLTLAFPSSACVVSHHTRSRLLLGEPSHLYFIYPCLRTIPTCAQLMQEKGKPEAEQARYRNMLNSLSAKVLVLETAARAEEVQAQARSDKARQDLCVRAFARNERRMLPMLTTSACSPAESAHSLDLQQDPASGGDGWCRFLHRSDHLCACVR